MGNVVEAVFYRRRGRRKDSSTAPESVTSSLSTMTASPTHSSLKPSAWSLSTESNAQEKFRPTQESREAKKKAQEREHRWDANAGECTTRAPPRYCGYTYYYGHTPTVATHLLWLHTHCGYTYCACTSSDSNGSRRIVELSFAPVWSGQPAVYATEPVDAATERHQAQ